MKTRDAIKDQGRQLFNRLGVKNVTLREIANQLGKSYGNITYHFSNKEKLITELFYDNNEELAQLQTLYNPGDNLLTFFLTIPENSFDITLKYLFFYKDFIELKRTYPTFYEKVEQLNSGRKSQWLKFLIQLQTEGFLKSTLSMEDLDYMMELSTAIRTFYFQNHEWEEFDQGIYIRKVNKLLYPYLSEQGRKVFDGAFS